MNGVETNLSFYKGRLKHASSLFQDTCMLHLAVVEGELCIYTIHRKFMNEQI